MVLSSFEHDFVEEESARDSSSKILTVQPTSSEQRNTVWNAKVGLTTNIVNHALLLILYVIAFILLNKCNYFDFDIFCAISFIFICVVYFLLII
jgi:hypothetical protein